MNTQPTNLLLQRNAKLEKELEVKNRELEIEAALERVRSRALAMHHSDELREVVTVVFKTLQALEFALQKAAAIICIFTESSKDHIQWIADPGRSYAMPFNIPYHDNPLPSDIFSAKESGEGFFSRLYPFETKNEYFNFLFTNSDYRHLPDDVKKMILESRSYGFSIAFAKNSAILVPTNTGTLLSENEANVLKRFANVFDQVYVRFLDLQKAEAQAREAQIQLALERVFHWFPVYTRQLLLVQMIFPQLGIPLTYSLHLAWEFRAANRDLRSQLIQVNELSQKSLEQEQEKQQLLASQNETLEQKVTQRTSELNASLNELKSTQAQLIQSEKMASLGELTAGIAHEIQNPLNFVNNFSEVNQELIEELKGERSKVNGERDEQLENELLNDIKENEQKISFHGKRADAIVKGMLQHSRQTKGVKEPTDINALCDEYLRLSYHGLRAKDKSFNADFKTDFDESIEKVNVVPQDIGRVLLNLFNNAFYAVAEKKKQQALPHFLNAARQEPYEPIVLVSTKKLNEGLEISVKDNGVGIPQKAVDKIFQPFFTTKPTGQGTGLGLSLSYDIIKAHGGELKVETKEGEGSEFVVSLPINHVNQVNNKAAFM